MTTSEEKESVDKQAERHVLAAAMNGDAGVREQVREQCNPEMFRVHRQLALAVFTLLEQDKVPDPESIKVLYDENMELVYSLASSSYTPDNAVEDDGAVDRIRDRYRARQVHMMARSSRTDIEEGEDPREVQRALENDLMDLDRNLESGRVQPVDAHLDEAARRLREASDGVSGLEVGLPTLSRLMNGIEDEDLILVGGRTSQGKTSLALTWLKYHCLRHDVPTAYFALEGSAPEITKRLIRMVGRVGDDPAEGEIAEARGRIESAPLYIDDSVSVDVSQVGSRVRQLKMDRDIGVVYIDYLQLMDADPSKSYDKKTDRVTDTVRTLKKIARKVGVAVVCVAQLNRGVEQRSPPEPRISDLREGGEDPADKVALVYRPEHYGITNLEDGTDTENYGEVKLVKHRDGPTGDVGCAFIKRYSMWAPMAERDQPTYDEQEEEGGGGGPELEPDDSMPF